jgi:hypothetical protein
VIKAVITPLNKGAVIETSYLRGVSGGGVPPF